jgi:hypothetical protein
MVIIYVDGTVDGTHTGGTKIGDVGKSVAGGTEIVETTGTTGTGVIYDVGIDDGISGLGTITYVVTPGMVTTGIDDGIKTAGTTYGVVVGKLCVLGKLIVDGTGGIYVGTVTMTVDGIDDGTSVYGIITAVVDGTMNTQCVNGAYVPGTITGLAKVTTDDGGKTECGTYGTVVVGNDSRIVTGIVTNLVDGTNVGTDEVAMMTNVLSGIETYETVDGRYVPGMITGDDGKSVTGGIGKVEIVTYETTVGTGITTVDGAHVGTDVAGIITNVVDGIVTIETVDGTNVTGITTGELGKTDAGGIERVAIVTVGTKTVDGTGMKTVDGTLVGTDVAAIITNVVDGIVTIVTVDGTNVTGITTGELGKTDGDGNERVTTVEVEIVMNTVDGTAITTVDGALVGTDVAGMITNVVDGTVTTETVDGTHVAGIRTGELGKTDGDGIERVETTIVTETIYDDTIGTFVGISDKGTEDGMNDVTDGAITIVFDVVNV